MLHANKSKRYTEKIGQFEKAESYQYLGFLIIVDRRNSINYRGLTKAQSGCRNSKLRAISKKFSWMLSNRKTTAGAVNDLILVLTRENFYGVINPTTDLSSDYKKKGAAHLEKWETASRVLIWDIYGLPIWTRTDILHSIIGIPHLRVLLMQQVISKIK